MVGRPALGWRWSRRQQASGYTLVEVLVALFAMTLLAALSWQGLDSVMRSRDAGGQSIAATTRLLTALTQWEQDLQAVQDTGVVPALTFDGQALRLTRRSEGGMILVSWAVQGGHWQRWASPATTSTQTLRAHWLRSQQLLGNEPGRLELAQGATDWQLYFHRGGAWSNAQSTGDFGGGVPAYAGGPGTTPLPPLAPAPGSQSGPPIAPPGEPSAPPGEPSAPPGEPSRVVLRERLPQAVRMVITLDGQQLTRSILLGASGA